MNLALSEDQRMIRESADGLLADSAASAQTRLAMQSPSGFDDGLWQRIAAELGWCAMAIPEEHGGLGLGPVELVQLLEPMGRHLLCAPFFSTVVLAAPLLLAMAGDEAQARWLPAIAQGHLRATAPMVTGTGDDWRTVASGIQARPRGADWRLDGIVDRLLDGANAELLLVPAHLADGSTAWFAIASAASGLQRRSLSGWDLTRRWAAIELSSVSALRIDAPRPADAARSAIALGRLCLAAEQLGGAQACLDLSVAYTAQRQQFGRTIAGFQAVKHRCASMMVAIEALRSTVYGAAQRLADNGRDKDAALEASMALALSKDTYFLCAQEAIQLHGGVGFTWEFDPQLHLKRAQAGSHWMGTSTALRARLADELLA